MSDLNDILNDQTKPSETLEFTDERDSTSDYNKYNSSSIEVSNLPGPYTLADRVITQFERMKAPIAEGIELKPEDYLRQDEWTPRYITSHVLQILKYNTELLYSPTSLYYKRILLLDELIFDSERFAENLRDIYWDYRDKGIDPYVHDTTSENKDDTCADHTSSDSDIHNEEDVPVSNMKDDDDLIDNRDLIKETEDQPECADNKVDSEQLSSIKGIAKTPILAKGITHFTKDDLEKIFHFHKWFTKYIVKYSKPVTENDELKTGYQEIVDCINMIGPHNMLRFLYANRDHKYLRSNLRVLFMFVVFTYTTPLSYEFFCLFFKRGITYTTIEDNNIFMPYYTEIIKPLVDEYINSTDFSIEDNQDYYILLSEHFDFVSDNKMIDKDELYRTYQKERYENGFKNTAIASLVEKNQQDRTILFKQYRNQMLQEGLSSIFERFNEYSEIDKKNENIFKKDIPLCIFIMHMIFLFDDPWNYLVESDFIFTEYLKGVLDRIFYEDEFQNYLFDIDKRNTKPFQAETTRSYMI